MRNDVSRRAIVASGAAAGVLAAGDAHAAVTAPRTVEQWGVFEVVMTQRGGINMSPDSRIKVVFERGGQSREIAAFWDGGDTWRARFSPDAQGEWTWRVDAAWPAWADVSGAFVAGPPSRGNHGPVQVANTYHFAYADGTPYRQVGTTCYAWTHQNEARCAQTLRSLAASPFNKMRMAVFPHGGLHSEPIYPFAREGQRWNYDRINPAFFRAFERRVAQLGAMGIEADLILFHGYDEARGFNAMTPAQDERYLRYIVARLSAYRNVWWSMANEWDLVKGKTEADFDRIFQIVRDADAHHRLRSIHNWRDLYDYNKAWVTHASIQNGAAVEDDARALLYRDAYDKPVVFDEVRYEGDLNQRWGNLTPQQMVAAFWQAHIAGTYCGHGESYQPDLWIGVGGSMRNISGPRLAFLKRVMEEGPAPGIDPLDRWWGRHIAGKFGHYYLRYFGESAPSEWRIDVPKDELTAGARFRADVLDTWNMTVTPIEGEFTLTQTGPYTFSDAARPPIALPSRPYMAVRLVRVT